MLWDLMYYPLFPNKWISENIPYILSLSIYYLLLHTLHQANTNPLVVSPLTLKYDTGNLPFLVHILVLRYNIGKWTYCKRLCKQDKLSLPHIWCSWQDKPSVPSRGTGEKNEMKLWETRNTVLGKMKLGFIWDYWHESQNAVCAFST